MLVTISDKKLGVDQNSDGVIDYYTADVLSAQDYHDGGMQKPGRKYQPNGRGRYEFYDGAVSFEYRVEDPRIVRFLSVDPFDQEFPWNSPYVVQENKFGMGRELEGLELTTLFGIQEVIAKPALETGIESSLFEAATTTSGTTSSGLSTWRVGPSGNIFQPKPWTSFDPLPWGNTNWNPFQPQLKNPQPNQKPGLQQTPQKEPQTKPNPERQFDPKQKPTKEDDGEEGYYFYETGDNYKSSSGVVDKSAGNLPYFGITKNAVIASVGINGRYAASNPRAKNISNYRGILGKADYFTAASVEAALIALNTYGKNFEKKLYAGELSSKDVAKSTRIDNQRFSNKNRYMMEAGISWLRKNYGKNWKDKFLHQENKKGKANP